MKYSSLIWDFDGTLFDTYPRMCRAFSLALDNQGCSAEESVILAQIKRSTRIATEYFSRVNGLDNMRLREDYLNIEHSLPNDSVRPYDGMEELLRDIAKLGGRNYLYTHRDAGALNYLKAFGLDGLFSGFVTAEDVFPPKPAPDAINYIVKHWNIPKYSALMIGDRDIDILCADAAGISGCLFDPDGFYHDFKTETRADSVEALARLLLL